MKKLGIASIIHKQYGVVLECNLIQNIITYSRYCARYEKHLRIHQYELIGN
jgi:hypothetical protein